MQLRKRQIDRQKTYDYDSICSSVVRQRYLIVRFAKLQFAAKL